MLAGIPTDVYDRALAQRYGTAKIADFGLSKSLALRIAPNAHSRRCSAWDALHCLAACVTAARLRLRSVDRALACLCAPGVHTPSLPAVCGQWAVCG